MEQKYKIISQSDKVTTYVTDLVVDADADVKNIDTSPFAPGSTVIALDKLNVYMLSTTGEWKLL